MNFGGFFDIQEKEKLILKINSELEDEKNLNNYSLFNNLLKEKSKIENVLNKFKNLDFEFNEIHEMLILIKSESDKLENSELKKEIESQFFSIYSKIKEFKLLTCFSGKFDNSSAFMDINSGAGGTESQDWAMMLARMYSRWAEKKKYKVEIISEVFGEEAGYKSISLKIIGENAFGWLKNENGIHRLVRISPFDSNAKRHTSFSSVYVYPEINDDINIEIEDKDLRIDTYRASGAGGQHVNKTESAIRITHIPTGFVVQCQNDRSQHRNKAEAFSMLRAKLYELEESKRKIEIDKNEKNKTEIGWGHQKRSYVLQPYQMVKDNITSEEDANANKVLDGEIDKFLESSIYSKK